MDVALTFVAMLLLVALLMLLRRSKAGSQRPGETTQPPGPVKSNEYHAVSIKYDTAACEAAKRLSGTRLLARDAPRLPLPGCDALDCNCHFQHHPDRRHYRDRRSPFASGLIDGTGNFKLDQRSPKDRRTDSGDDDF